jgi:hypothetical protein
VGMLAARQTCSEGDVCSVLQAHQHLRGQAGNAAAQRDPSCGREQCGRTVPMYTTMMERPRLRSCGAA